MVRPCLARWLVPIALLSGAIPAAGAQDPVAPAPPVAVRVDLPDVSDRLALLGDSSAYVRVLSERPGPFMDLLVTPAQRRRLEADGRSWRALRPGEWFDPGTAAAAAAPAFSNYTFASMQADLNALAAAHPGQAQLSILGSGHDGNPIYVMKVSDQVGQVEDEPRVFFMGQHHAGEAIGVDCCMAILHDLLDGYGSDPIATARVDACEIYVVPMANPDGWNKLESGAVGSWRKNTADNNNNGTFNPNFDGVDLNRNLSFNWSMAGSGSPGSDVYFGTGPLTEPEDQAIAALGASARFALTLTYHMSGEVIILPWTWNGKKTPDHATYSNIGSALAAKIPSLWSGKYGWFAAGDTGGYLDDHLYGWHGTLCYTVEVSANNNTASINQAVANNLLGAQYILDRATVGQITGRVTNAQTGEPVSASIQIRQIDTSSLAPRTSDAAFGRFRWILKNATYTLHVESTQGYAVYEQGGLVVTSTGATVHDVALQPLEAWIGGTPVTGQPIAFHLDGVAGDDQILLLSMGTGSATFPPFTGSLLLDLNGLLLLDSGTLGPSGSLSLPVTIPDNPVLIGLTLHYQALTGPSISGGQAHFSNAAAIEIL